MAKNEHIQPGEVYALDLDAMQTNELTKRVPADAVRFVMDDKTFFDVRIVDGRLEVHLVGVTNRSVISVRPRASNCIHVEPTGW